MLLIKPSKLSTPNNFSMSIIWNILTGLKSTAVQEMLTHYKMKVQSEWCASLTRSIKILFEQSHDVTIYKSISYIKQD